MMPHRQRHLCPALDPEPYDESVYRPVSSQVAALEDQHEALKRLFDGMWATIKLNLQRGNIIPISQEARSELEMWMRRWHAEREKMPPVKAREMGLLG